MSLARTSATRMAKVKREPLSNLQMHRNELHDCIGQTALDGCKCNAALLFPALPWRSVLVPCSHRDPTCYDLLHVLLVRFDLRFDIRIW